MKAPSDEMKLGAEVYGSLDECIIPLSPTPMMITRFVSCSSRRKREMRIAVIL